MHRSKFAGALLYPVLFGVLTAAAVAQSTPDTTTAPDSTQQTAPVQPPSANQTASPAQADTSSSSQNPPPAPTEQQRAELARQAQARVQARRQQRINAVIQDTYSHKYEIFGGYAFMRMRPGHDLQAFTETGFDIGMTRYLNNKLGVTVDGRGNYGVAYVGDLQNSLNIYEPSVSNYSIEAGPSYRFLMKQKWGLSAVAMAGWANNLFYANSQGTPGTLVGLYPNNSTFGATVGLPIDYNLGPGLSIRLTPNYYLTHFGGEFQNNKSITAGINYRFGRR